MARDNMRSTSLEQYLREANRYPLLTPEEVHDLAVRFRETGDAAASRKLVNSNLRFVVKVASQYRGYDLDLTDLIQEGNVGLLIAVQRFDPTHGNRLLSYAVWWIKACIQSYVASHWSLVRVLPTSAQRRLLFGRHPTTPSGETPKPPPVAAPTERKTRRRKDPGDVGQWHRVANMARHYLDLDGTVSEDRRMTLAETMAAPGDDAEVAFGRAEVDFDLSARLDVLRARLTDKEQVVLDQRLLSDDPATLQDIGKQFGITRERVRQVERGLKRKLARKLSPAFAVA